MEQTLQDILSNIQLPSGDKQYDMLNIINMLVNGQNVQQSASYEAPMEQQQAPKDVITEFLKKRTTDDYKNAQRTDAALRGMYQQPNGAKPQFSPLDTHGGMPATTGEALADAVALSGKAPGGAPGETDVNVDFGSIYGNRANLKQRMNEAENANELNSTKMENDMLQSAQNARMQQGQTKVGAIMDLQKMKQDRLNKQADTAINLSELGLKTMDVLRQRADSNDEVAKYTLDYASKLFGPEYSPEKGKFMEAVSKLGMDPQVQQLANTRGKAFTMNFVLDNARKYALGEPTDIEPSDEHIQSYVQNAPQPSRTQQTIDALQRQPGESPTKFQQRQQQAAEFDLKQKEFGMKEQEFGQKSQINKQNLAEGDLRLQKAKEEVATKLLNADSDLGALAKALAVNSNNKTSGWVTSGVGFEGRKAAVDTINTLGNWFGQDWLKDETQQMKAIERAPALSVLAQVRSLPASAGSSDAEGRRLTSAVMSASDSPEAFNAVTKDVLKFAVKRLKGNGRPTADIVDMLLQNDLPPQTIKELLQ